jgi:hypothetical protein
MGLGRRGAGYPANCSWERRSEPQRLGTNPRHTRGYGTMALQLQRFGDGDTMFDKEDGNDRDLE